jgi:hypothetical protein
VDCTGDALVVDEAWLTGQAPGSEVLPEALRDQEKGLIAGALARSHGKVAARTALRPSSAARDPTLESKIRRLKIEKARCARPIR